MLGLLAGASAPALATPQLASPFVIKPYLQLGDTPKLAAQESVWVLWHAADQEADWRVEVKRAGSSGFSLVSAPQHRLVKLQVKPSSGPLKDASGRFAPNQPIAPHRVYRARLDQLAPGSEFEYRVFYQGRQVFAAAGKARSGPGQNYRVALVGDLGVDTAPPRAVAHQIYQHMPDFIAIPGDVVYMSGRICEYRENYYPFYNCDFASPADGAPLIRSRITVAGLGEHDTGLASDRDANDLLGYYLYWQMPQNGPPLKPGDPSTYNLNLGSPAGQALLACAQHNFPRMAHYSFDYGDTHWTVLDTARHVDWNSDLLRQWLREDLAAARDARWRFVVCYLSMFHSGKEYQRQKMRVIADILQDAGVDVVFGGCHHSYQRSHPLRFQKNARVIGPVLDYDTAIEGRFTVDRKFDGKTVRKPDGILYITTGCGGNSLHNGEQTAHRDSWQPFTARFIADRHSFTVMEVGASELTIRQISADGQDLDHITVSRS